MLDDTPLHQEVLRWMTLLRIVDGKKTRLCSWVALTGVLFHLMGCEAFRFEVNF